MGQRSRKACARRESTEQVALPQRMFFLYIYIYIYIFVCLFSLVMPGLGFHTRNLQSPLRCGGSLIAACELLAVACAVWFPDQGLNTGPLHWECGVLATGQPGKSH